MKKLVFCICYLFYPDLKNCNYPIPWKAVLKCIIIQKIFRINSHVPWPVHHSTKVTSPQNIIRRKGARFPGLSMGCHIDGRNGIKIGKNVWIGPRVSIISMNHDVNNYHSYVECNPIVIQDNCWLGANVIILPNVHLGEHTIVAAGAVVTKSFPDGNQLIAGNPAKLIRNLTSYNS